MFVLPPARAQLWLASVTYAILWLVKYATYTTTTFHYCFDIADPMGQISHTLK